MKNHILDNIQTENTWLDVETVAKLKGISKRGVRLAINNYEHKVENTRGGKTYKIRLSSLEEELQIKYIQEYYNDFKADGNEIIELNNLKIKQEKLISEEQKKQALAKYDIIKLWLEFRKSLKADKKKNIIDPSFKNVRSDKQFEILFNTGTLYPDVDYQRD